MPRTRIDFRSLTLFEDEESGDTHMAMYATVRDSGGNTVGQFQWNNGGNKVNETNTYPLNNDPGNISTIDFELDTFGTITVEGFADDDQDWPNAGSNENSLGSAALPSIRACQPRWVRSSLEPPPPTTGTPAIW